MTSTRLLLLDTASLYYRAFYGLPTSITAPDGTPVNAVRGILDFLALLIQQYQPQELACCWDEAWRPRWRVELLPSYKAHRVTLDSLGQEVEDAPAQLQAQLPLLRQVLRTAQIPVLSAPDMEADDVVGTLTRRVGSGVKIVTGDQDLFQLVNDDANIQVLYTARGVKAHEVVTEEHVTATFGVSADQFRDYLVLVGDPSDGIAGIRGIGAKTAARLLQQFGNTTNMLRAAEHGDAALTPKLAAALTAGRDYLTRATEVVTVRTDAPVPHVALALPDLSLSSRRENLSELAQTWGLSGPVTRLIDACSPAP